MCEIKITACAVQLPNACIISMHRPARHHDILNTHGGCAEGKQGFLTSEGHFVDRKEALAIAKSADQIVRRCGGDETRLFSENLW